MIRCVYNITKMKFESTKDYIGISRFLKQEMRILCKRQKIGKNFINNK
jgi:hypothetical protein